MPLSTKVGYAVMPMVELAYPSYRHPVPVAELSSRQKIFLSYLEQLFAKLRLLGFVNSVRGRSGRY